jgi:5'-methylthioadenosine phosphorylase
MAVVKLTSPPKSAKELGVEELPDLAIIGGSGLYDPGIFESPVEVQMHTPYGFPSDNVIVGRVGGPLGGLSAQARPRPQVSSPQNPL